MIKKALSTVLLASVASCTLSFGAIYAEEKEKAAKWDVTQPDFQTEKSEATIDTRQGTWMSLDVSPDGSVLAFDLLGDIYTMPIGGGKATNISAGHNWDMQPRWSPDGKSIAFTSDRKGGDNIWVMKSDGTDAKQITSESFRLMNNPSWSPDGTMIAAKKHFTTQRSLGTGEIWLYHINGGKGVQVVKRPSKAHQKELGEPTFAPDGKSIYYTQNITPGSTFIYAQDSNTELFRIKSVELASGKITDVAGGPGGAVTATPSPDGKTLAFVRRVRAQSRLFVRDLETGVERMIYADLDEDMQETWAVQGVYPNMDWTSDNKSVVFWSGGKINRIDVKSGKVSDIPFHVKDTRTIYKAKTFKTEVAADTFDTKMTRWASRSPDGASIVFESLGNLWIKKGDAEPKRLTSDKGNHFELYPSWSPDGKWVYFTTWNDQTLSAIHRVKSGGGKSKVLSKTQGHYLNPVVSPDGKTLVFTKARGGRLVSPDFGANPGIYTMPASGGDATFVTNNGRGAHFGASSDRIYVSRTIKGKQALVSMDLDGERVRDHAHSSLAREMKISPSGNHVAFIENYHVFVSPLPTIGKPIEIGPKGKAMPIKKVSKDGGTFVNWSSDGSTVSWSIGPVFKSVSITDAYKEDFKPVESGVNLSMKVNSEKPSGLFALTGARIITMDDTESVIEGGVILIEDNRIKAIGKVGEVKIPAGVKTIDMGGKTIMPGIIDIHAHGSYASNMIVPQQNWVNYATLALGVTTVHDPSNRASSVFAASEYSMAGKVLTPRMYSTAEIVYGAKAGVWAPVDGLDDALAHIRRLKAQGAISVKNYNQPRREQRQQVTEAARREGLNVVVEGGSLYHMDMNMVVDGNTGIEHTLPNQAIYDDVVQLWSQTNVGYTPTLLVGYGAINGEDYWYQHSQVWKHPILSKFVPPKVLQPRSVRRQAAPDADYGQFANAAMAKQLMDKGVIVNIGAHGQREGLGSHWEIWMFEQGGMSAMDSLKTATINPAKYMGLEEDLGSLEAGKLADLVIMNENPLDNIRNTDKVSHVMLNGRLYESGTLNEVMTGSHKSKPFYWHGKPESAIR